MPDAVAPALLEALGLARRRHVHLVGGGGKTTLMFAAARALAAAGRTVLTTTSTRILWPAPEDSARVVQGGEAAALVERLRAELAARRHVTVLGPGARGGKAVGLPLAVLDALAESGVADHLLVEADGSAGRPLKAHLAHEPVVSARADLVVAVVGATCLGAPMDDAHVHRAALLRERLGRPEGATVAPGDVAEILLGAGGWLERVAPGTAVAALLNQADTPARLAAARALAAALRARDGEGRLERIVLGDVRNSVFEVAG
mgnify:CR=1 FL=1